MPDPINWSLALPYLLSALAFGYLVGSIPFGLLLTRIAGLGDVRDIGSGNIGATNVLRTGNKAIALATLACDVAKGAVSVLVALNWGIDTAVCAGFGAFIGHILPIWLKFKGGKGVATFIGVQLGLYWPVALAFLAVWLIVALIFRFSSLSAMVASLLSPVFAAYWHQWQLAEVFGAIALIILLTHRENIARLVRGDESRISFKAKSD